MSEEKAVQENSAVSARYAGSFSPGSLSVAPLQTVAHLRYVFFQMAEVTVPHQRFAAILDRIQRLRAVLAMASSG